MTLARRTQLSVFVDNVPGALARITGALAAKGVNVTALAAWGGSDHGVVRLIASDPKVATHLLGEAGMLVTEQPVLELTLPNRPGVTQDVARRLAAARVNVEYLYGADVGDSGVIILRVDAITRAEGALRTSPFFAGPKRARGRAAPRATRRR